MKNVKQSLIIGILTYQRNELLERTLSSLLCYNDLSMIKIVCFDNGSDEECREINQNICQKYGVAYFYQKINIINELCLEEVEKNIMNGIAKLFEMFIDSGEEFCFLLEDDWTCLRALNVIELLNFLKNNLNIGQIRLREAEYNDMYNGYSTINFISGKPIQWIDEFKNNNYMFKIGTMHWTNNPSIFRTQTIHNLKFKNYNSELDLMADFYKFFNLNAQIIPGMFKHSGPWRIRQDLVEKGVI